jgi:hypothetical protein
MSYAIESGIEIPARMASRKRDKPPLPDVLAKLKVGQSVLVDDMSYSGVAAAMRIVAERTKYEFTMRNVDGGVRVWRQRAKRSA